MKNLSLLAILLPTLLVACSDMTDWQDYNDAGWEKNDNEEFHEAIKLYQIAYEKIHFGVFIDKEGLATLTTNMAATYRALGDYKNAKKFYLESLNAWEKLVGKEHENYAIIASNYSLFLEGQNQFEEALKYAKEALSIRKRIYSENNENIVISHRALSSIYLNIGHYELAIDHAKSAVTSAVEATGEKSELAASSELSLGRAYRTTGDIGAAQKHIANANEIYNSVSPSSTWAADTINELALLEQSVQKYDLAESNFNRALDIYLKIYGDNHPNISIMYENIAVNYADWGRYSDAYTAIQYSLKIRRLTYGKTHSNTKKIVTLCIYIAELNQVSAEACRD